MHGTVCRNILINIYIYIYIYDVLKLLVSCWLQITLMGTCRARTQGPNRRHWHGISQKPSECQVNE